MMLAPLLEMTSFVESETDGQSVERLARHDLGAQLGEEAFVAPRELDEQVIGGDGLDHGVAQKLQPFVVDRLSVVQNQRS